MCEMKSRPWSLLLLLVCGCSGPSIVGKWTVTPADPLAIPATVTATFGNPNQLTVFVEAKPTIPFAGDFKVEADVSGTWRIEGDKISVNPNEVVVKSSMAEGQAKGLIADEVERQVKDTVSKSATGTMKWEGADKITITNADGKTAILARIKS